MKIPKFFERLGLRKNPNGETVRVADGFQNIGNGYFREIGQYFKTAQILLFVLLFLIVTVFALTNSDSITYENLYYFVKDFRTAVDNADACEDAISYETDTNPSFAVYKGGLAVAGTERLRLLTASGGLNSSSVLGFADPAMSVSTDLLLVYGRGENKCHIYNSFTRIYSEVIEGAIRTAYLSESGAYSVTAEDEEYESAVYVYSRNFRKLNKYNLNSYVISAPLSDDGKTVAILSYVCVDGVYETRVRLAEVGSDRIYCDYSVDNAFPLGVSFMGDGSVLVLTDGSLSRITTSGGGSIVSDLSDRSVSAFSFDENGIVLALRNQAGTSGDTVSVFNREGTEIKHIAVDRAVRTVRKCGNAIFYRTDTEIVRFFVNSDGSELQSCLIPDGDLLVLSEDTVLLCRNGEAKYYRFGK